MTSWERELDILYRIRNRRTENSRPIGSVGTRYTRYTRYTPQTPKPSRSFYLPPCFIPPATTAASTWLIYNCILTVELLKILTFYAISVCFWLQKPLKSKNSAELVPLHCVFPLTPYSYWPLLSNSGRSVFTCQKINPAICAISGFL